MRSESLEGKTTARKSAIYRGARLRRAWRVESLENRLYLSAAYTWQNINIGAGGFVTGIFYDPHNANVIYARTDVGGLYKTVNDGTNWTQLLNWVGNGSGGSNGVLSFAIDPENSNNIYADTGLYSGSDGYVLYSTNAGATWGVTPLSFYVGGNEDGRGAGERIAVDPYDSNIIFLGSNANGLWESTNAGHSFSQVTSFSTSASINLVLFDPNGGTAGNPTKEIFVGEDSTASGTNLFETTNGGTSWTEVTGTGSAPTAFMPERAAMASDGNLYLAYANDQAPTEPTNGGLFRYNTSTGVWANISPVVPQSAGAPYDDFGYCGLALDPNSPTTIVVASLDRYNYGEQIWRTTNASASTPTWTALYDTASYSGYAPTRNTTTAPYMASSGDNIGNWACTVAIDPFNSAQIMHGYGGGIWATNDGTSTTTLTAPNSWYFPDTGIVMTAVLGLNAPTGGMPLYGAMGDVGGFAFTTLTFSPTQGNVFFNGGGGNLTSVDSAGADPQDAVMVGNLGTVFGFYTTNGVTFSQFSSNPGGSSGYSNGTVAMSANGSTIVWAPSGEAAYYTTNNGSSWTLATLVGGGALPTGGTILSDKVNPNYFYYWTENSSDNSWTLYISSNGGKTFAPSAGGALGTGNPTLAVSPTIAGQLWLGTYVGIYESTNFGASFSHPNTYSTNVSQMAVGASAPGSSYPAIYIYGTPAGDSFDGIYRSDDGGNTWLLLNNSTEQWSGTMAADPNVFGRVYMANEIGNPATSLPSGWSDTDINEPGNPGWATSSTTLSTGSIVNQWNIAGGGAGFSSAPFAISSLSRTGGVATAVTTTASGVQVGQTITISGASNSAYDGTFVVTALYNTTAGLKNQIGAATEFTFAIASGTDTASGTITATLPDQFNYAYEPVSGSTGISAQLLGLTNADNGSGTPQAGVMYRASTNPVDPFIELAQTSAGNLVLEYRTASGGAVTTQTVSGVPVGSEYVELVRSGSTFTAFYGPDGINWTQLGSPVSITAMPTSANLGLAASASYNPQLTDATFANVDVTATQAPTVATPAAATPNPVTGTTTALTVLGADVNGESNLTYNWAATGPATVSYTGASNGTNAGKNITAVFSQAGTYSFTVTITDMTTGLFTNSTVSNVVVQQTATTVTVSPGSTSASTGSTAQFSATVDDQFGNAISNPPITWAVTGTGNSISSTGLVTLGSTAGIFVVTATDGAISNTASLTAEASPTLTSFQINDGNAQRAMIDSLTLVFSQQVSLASGALTLNQRSTTGGAPTPMTFTQSTPDGGATWILTFTDPSYIGHSLPDGIYDLTVTSADVTDAADLPIAGPNSTFSFYRLYGDFEGTGSVNGTDFSILASVFGSNVGTGGGLWFVDYYGVGSVNGSDFSQFAARFGSSTSFTPQVLEAAQPRSTGAKSSAALSAPVTSTVLTSTATPRRHRHGRK
jgi:hypothetical protein